MYTKNFNPVYDVYDSLNLYGNSLSRKMVSLCFGSNVWVFPFDTCTARDPKYVGTD